MDGWMYGYIDRSMYGCIDSGLLLVEGYEEVF